MAADNAANVRRIFDAFNAHDLSRVDDLISPDYVNHDMPMPAPGREGFKQLLAGFFSAFPDMHLTVEAVLEDGDLVASRGTMTGTHQGEFQGIPPSGKRISAGYIDIWRFADGVAVENWVKLNMLAMLQQMGAIPQPG